MSSVQKVADNRSIGEILKGRRQELKLSVTDIASQMRLDPRIVDALETGNYQILPAPLYVRGYLRGYAKILKLDPDPLVALYDGQVQAEPPEIVPEVKHRTQTSSRDKPVKAFTYLVSLTLVILLLAWWQSNFVVRSRVTPMPGADSAVADTPPPPQLAYPITIVKHPDSPFYRAPVVETATAGGDPAATGREISGGVEGPDHVLLRLNADSWVEVTDSSGARLFMNLARAGNVLSLTGTAPFSVLLGFAHGVNVEFNGKPFDPAPYSRSGIARFTLSN